ncbi:unnamed protein product [Adineta ricciae]|uniref:Calponin-homology (CH) domain-containing protein n=1 Tax=Adineta ricciae TaxID=249248 RepID=A0A815LC58_ADIRI|nr:unnamed protein product [Adineta ricciae]
MDDIQLINFLKFINHHLSLRKDHEQLHIDDFIKDLSNGHVLIDLIEILSSSKFKRERGHTRFHSLTNVQIVLDYLKSRMQHINISPHEIVSGNRKQILALLWIIMKTFDFPGFRITNKNCFVENTLLGCGQDRSVTVKWLNNILNQSLNSIQIYIKDFYLQTWINGYYLSIIIKYLVPLSVKYLTMKCFDYLKQLETVHSQDKQRFYLCLTISNYCFDTLTAIDEKDQSERCLFRYFTELQQNILAILKTNHTSKLLQSNPYTKQILDTVIQTSISSTGQSAHVINNSDQYLTCIEDDQQQQHISTVGHKDLPMNFRGQSVLPAGGPRESTNLRTVEKSRLVNDQQEQQQRNSRPERQNRWKKTETLQSDVPAVDSHDSRMEIVAEKQLSPNDTPEKSDRSVSLPVSNEHESKSDQSVVACQNFEQPTSTVEQTNHINEQQTQPKVEIEDQSENNENIEKEISIPTNEKLDQPVAILEERQENKQPVDIDEPSNENTKESDETEKSTIVSVQEQISENITLKCEEMQRTDTSNTEKLLPAVNHENVEQPIDNNSSDYTNVTVRERSHEEFLLFNEIPEPEMTVTSVATDVESKQPTMEESASIILSTEKSAEKLNENNTSASLTAINEPTPSTVPKNKTKKRVNKKIVNEVPMEFNEKPTIKVEETEDNKSDCVPSTISSINKLQDYKQVELQAVTNLISTIRKDEQPIVDEPTQSIVSNSVIMTTKQSNDEVNKSTAINSKKSNHNVKKLPQVASSNKENHEFSTFNKQPVSVVKESDQRKLPNEQTTGHKRDKSFDIIHMSSTKADSEPVQPAASSDKQERVTLSKKRVISPIVSLEKSEQTIAASEVIDHVPLMSTNKRSEQSEALLERQEQSVSALEQACTPVVLRTETKKLPPTNKKSRASNAKKVNSIVKNGDSREIPSENEKDSIETLSIVQEQKPQAILVETAKDKLSPDDAKAQPSSVLRSRKNKKKKTVATTNTTLIEKASSVTLTPTANRSFLLTIQECLLDRKSIAFKFVFILACVCFSIYYYCSLA